MLWTNDPWYNFFSSGEDNWWSFWSRKKGTLTTTRIGKFKKAVHLGRLAFHLNFVRHGGTSSPTSLCDNAYSHLPCIHPDPIAATEKCAIETKERAKQILLQFNFKMKTYNKWKAFNLRVLFPSAKFTKRTYLWPMAKANIEDMLRVKK